MIRILYIFAALSLATTASAQDHKAHKGHASHEHEHHEEHDHESHDHGSVDHDATPAGDVAASVTLSRTPEIDAALADGGEAVVAEVLGAVCDFCAKAMNRTFGRRDEVAAVYVDLDAKTLNLVFNAGAFMADDEIDRTVVRAGYKTKAIHRGAHLLGGADAADPA